MELLNSKQIARQTIDNLFKSIIKSINSTKNLGEFYCYIPEQLPDEIIKELKAKEYKISYDGTCTRICWKY